MRGARDGSHFWVQQTPDQNGIVRQYMKWDHRLEYQDNPGLIVSRALQIAQSEPRGPVYLSLPREIAFLPADGARFPTAQQLGITRRAGARSRRHARAGATAGQGAQPGNRRAALRPQSRDRAGPGARSPRSSVRRSATRRHAAINAFPWTIRSTRASTLDLSQCDVVLVIEADVPWMPGPQQPPSDAYIAVIDIDPIKAHIGTYEFGAHLRLMADTAISLGLLLGEVEKLAGAGDRTRFAERAARFADLTRARIRESERAAQEQAGKSPISPLWLSSPDRQRPWTTIASCSTRR